jgi:aspartyl-tRNA(Asn)/glutamyl-tRNA(Gln) amidotransferase subunit B
MNGNTPYDIVIGLEVHIQLDTRTKLFCNDEVSVTGAPNEYAGPITLGLPGTLPRLNREALQMAVTLGLALDCTIDHEVIFARKHYFYPDLSKGFQTSQHTRPVCSGGHLEIALPEGKKTITLTRIHLEEDAGKSIHDALPGVTCIDYNRAGTPLCELVTEPCLTSSAEASVFLTELRRLVRWVGVSNGNMEEGSLRCDANISLKPAGSTILGTRVEVKNLNSIRFVKNAIDIEVARMTALLQEGKKITQETRSFDAANNSTFTLRSKEDAEDYRYLPEPDLAPVAITPELIDGLKKKMPVLPQALEHQLIKEYALTPAEAGQLTAEKETASYYGQLVNHLAQQKKDVDGTTAASPAITSAAANWILGPVKSYLNENNSTQNEFPLTPQKLAGAVQLVLDKTISFSTASGRLLNALLKNPEKDAAELVREMNLFSNNDETQLEQWVTQVLEKYPDKVTAYQKGKKGLSGFFTGEVMKLSKGRANPELLQQLIEKKLN